MSSPAPSTARTAGRGNRPCHSASCSLPRAHGFPSTKSSVIPTAARRAPENEHLRLTQFGSAPHAVISDIPEHPAQICPLSTRAYLSRLLAAFHLRHQPGLVSQHRARADASAPLPTPSNTLPHRDRHRIRRLHPIRHRSRSNCRSPPHSRPDPNPDAQTRPSHHHAVAVPRHREPGTHAESREERPQRKAPRRALDRTS